MKLFVGLGNPGAKYERNRHNIGFMAVERIADRYRFPAWRRKFEGLATEGTIDGERVLLLKPETYMNDSGRSVGEAARFLKIDITDIILFHDELDLDPGRLKVKVGGGNAGHNGLRSTSAHIGNEYARVRIGIGHPGSKDAVVHFVLNDFAKSEANWVEPMLDAIAASAPWLAKGKADRFQSDIARLTSAAADEPAPKPVAAKPVVPKPARHPAGERAAKAQNAIAENLKKWLAGKTTKSD
ncbi:MAG: aminoacyl-tRNA hydrolase [Hyphomicrobiaceae bacterium]